MKLYTLGTSCMFPTKDRLQPAFLLFHDGTYLMFDAGEGAQRQLRLAGLSPMDINHLFITHWHGDHSLGVAGMIQCMSGNRRTKPFNIYGPPGTKERVNHIMSAFDFWKGFKVVVHEVSPNRGLKQALRINDLTVSAFKARHKSYCLNFIVKEDDKRRINLDYTKKFGLTKHPLLGKLQRGEDIVYEGNKITVDKGTVLKPGRKFCYVTDTAYFAKIVEWVEGADLLLCESTYGSDLEELAVQNQHLTAEQAAMLASDAGVKKLVLTHFSQRYPNVKQLLREAKKHFKKVVAAEDLMTFEF